MRAEWDGYSPVESVCLSNYYLCKRISRNIRVTVPAADVLVADVFGTGIFH